MSGKENADANLSEMEGDDSARTVNCLRVRLLAERVASRNARQEADQLENKLLELENLLKEEAKSRNRAEKKLKFLTKRLQCMNIPYATDESEHSGLLDTSNISSATSLDSSSTKQPEKGEILHMNISTVSESQESNEIVKSSKGDFAYHSNGCLNQEDGHDPDNHVDNSMALVPVDVPQKNQTIDPEVLDTTVKEVLDALRRAKEQLQSSMERRRMSMIKVVRRRVLELNKRLKIHV
ncbi:UNVERIFIED_CONTAM: hypothetical protein Sangu_1359900 [Sesamum angustifolium]|uniref:Uncharacterized protein n=1 Tax=Sesamum angustifolium TaxID=2727405 RepID=A0AAW2N5R5_9LAMI